jgi:hypothetical protein
VNEYDDVHKHIDRIFSCQLTGAVEFCRHQLRNNVEQIENIQQEHRFDTVPFADIASQQRDHIRAIKHIVFTGSSFIDNRHATSLFSI